MEGKQRYGPDSQPVPCRWREGPQVWPSSVSLLLCGSLSSWGPVHDGCYSELRRWEQRDIAESLGLCTGRGRWSMRSRASLPSLSLIPLHIGLAAGGQDRRIQLALKPDLPSSCHKSPHSPPALVPVHPGSGDLEAPRGTQPTCLGCAPAWNALPPQI